MVFINELTVAQLKSFAKNFEIFNFKKLTGYSRLRKNDLVKLIKRKFEERSSSPKKQKI